MRTNKYSNNLTNVPFCAIGELRGIDESVVYDEESLIISAILSSKVLGI